MVDELARQLHSCLEFISFATARKEDTALVLVHMRYVIYITQVQRRAMLHGALWEKKIPPATVFSRVSKAGEGEECRMAKLRSSR